MRVLLKEGAEQASPATILVVDPDLTETVLATLFGGEGTRGGGIVDEVDNATLAGLIVSSVEELAAQGMAVRPMPTIIGEVAWMACVLAPFEIGSRIVQHITQDGCVLDKTQARRTDPISSITPEERRSAEQAGARGEYGCLASRLGRLGDARDAAGRTVEELRQRPDSRAVDVYERERGLHSYDRGLTELRAAQLTDAVEKGR